MKVLVVEDTELVAERLTEILGELPECDFVTVVDTENAALASMYKWSIDLIILDLHLREGSGFGVLRAMAAMAVRPQVIVLTNHNLEEYHSAAIALGASHFLDKARDFERLPAIIGGIAGRGPKH